MVIFNDYPIVYSSQLIYRLTVKMSVINYIFWIRCANTIYGAVAEFVITRSWVTLFTKISSALYTDNNSEYEWNTLFGIQLCCALGILGCISYKLGHIIYDKCQNFKDRAKE